MGTDTQIDFLTAEVLPNLPNYFRPEEGDQIPLGLIGSKIIRFGTLAKQGSVEGGGLIVDYLPENESVVRRVVLEFNELGMWLAFCHDG